LPHPLGPTRAVVFPDDIDKFKSWSSGAVGHVGYAKYKMQNSISLVQVVGRLPLVESGSSRDGLLIMENNSAAADEAFVMAPICGRKNRTDVASSITLRTTVKTVPTS
jgi:hypothetical protein